MTRDTNVYIKIMSLNTKIVSKNKLKIIWIKDHNSLIAGINTKNS